MKDSARSFDRKFGKETRLRGRSKFASVLRGEKASRLKGIFCRISMNESESDATEFGLSVSKKAGGAVRRNRIKRIIREFLRNNKTIWPPNKSIIIRIDSPIDDEKALINEIERLLGEIQ